jgi:hypothetical protein
MADLVGLDTLPHGSTVGDAVCLLPWVATLPIERLERGRGPVVRRNLSEAAHRGLLQWIHYRLARGPSTLDELGTLTGLGARGINCLLMPFVRSGAIVKDGDWLRAPAGLSWE